MLTKRITAEIVRDIGFNAPEGNIVVHPGDNIMVKRMNGKFYWHQIGSSKGWNMVNPMLLATSSMKSALQLNARKIRNAPHEAPGFFSSLIKNIESGASEIAGDLIAVPKGLLHGFEQIIGKRDGPLRDAEDTIKNTIHAAATAVPETVKTLANLPKEFRGLITGGVKAAEDVAGKVSGGIATGLEIAIPVAIVIGGFLVYRLAQGVEEEVET